MKKYCLTKPFVVRAFFDSSSMRILHAFFLLLFTVSVFGQDNIQHAINKINDLFEKPAGKPQVYLLGTFHFAGEKIDSNRTEFKWRYIVDEPRRKKEIEVVRKNLIKIKPTIICVEVHPKWQSELDSVYSAYCTGKDISSSGYDGEIVLLAFEVGKRLGLKRIVAIDAQPMAALRDEKIYSEYEKYAPKEDKDSVFNYWNNIYNEKLHFSDSLRHRYTTIDFLRFINQEDYNKKTLGRWLIFTRFGTNTYPIGADQFITKYYNRNIRIYSNIQRSISNNYDRVLVIYGNTHMSVLRNLFESSPLYILVPIDKFLR
jgi:hypothetical protein